MRRLNLRDGSRKLAAVLFYLLLVLCAAAMPARADISGFFEITTLIIPQTTSSEVSPVRVDFENNLTTTISVGIFGWSFHGHGGITGIEDIISSAFVNLFGFRIEPKIIAAQAFQRTYTPSGFPIPMCLTNAPGSGHCDFMLVSQRLEASITFVGVTVRNLALFEDTTFPNPLLTKPPGAIYPVQSQSFGFGDVISFEGQTRSGINIHGATGLCAQNTPKKIKKHNLPYSVNPHCAIGASSASLPFFFDFEKFSITGIPIASGILLGSIVECTTIFQCELTQMLNVNTGPLPFSANFVLSNLLSFNLSSVAVSVTHGAGTLALQFETAGIVSYSIHLAMLLNPQTLPGRLNLSLVFSPGLGITDLLISFGVVRSGLTATATASFVGAAGTFSFSRLTATTSAQMGIVKFDSKFTFKLSGLESAHFSAIVSF